MVKNFVYSNLNVFKAERRAESKMRELPLEFMGTGNGDGSIEDSLLL
jgi:hypothetical protein